MQVQSVQSINSNVGFKSSDDLEKASVFVNMNDAQLRKLAVKLGHNKKEQNEKNKRAITATFWSIPIVDTIANGVLAKNALITEGKEVAAVLVDKATPLSIKAHAALKTAGMWGLVIGAFGLYKSIKHAVAPESDNPKNRRLHNPIGSILIDIGVLLGGITLISAGIRNIIEGCPEKFDKMKNNYINKLEKLDKTDLNTKTLPELRKFAEKSPGIAAAGRFLLANSIWIILGAGIYKVFNNAIEERRKIDRTYRELKVCQGEAAKVLVNTLGVERDVLAQENKGLATDLRKTITEEKPVSAEEVVAMKKEIKALEKEKAERELKQIDEEIAKTREKIKEKETEIKAAQSESVKLSDKTESSDASAIAEKIS